VKVAILLYVLDSHWAIARSSRVKLFAADALEQAGTKSSLLTHYRGVLSPGTTKMSEDLSSMNLIDRD
jgi:hypothetical protein